MVLVKRRKEQRHHRRAANVPAHKCSTEVLQQMHKNSINFDYLGAELLQVVSKWLLTLNY